MRKNMIAPYRHHTIHRLIGRENAYEGLVGKPERQTALRSPRHRWKDNIKLYLKEIK
jgi:hypothetical protein